MKTNDNARTPEPTGAVTPNSGKPPSPRPSFEEIRRIIVEACATRPVTADDPLAIGWEHMNEITGLAVSDDARAQRLARLRAGYDRWRRAMNGELLPDELPGGELTPEERRSMAEALDLPEPNPKPASALARARRRQPG